WIKRSAGLIQLVQHIGIDEGLLIVFRLENLLQETLTCFRIGDITIEIGESLEDHHSPDSCGSILVYCFRIILRAVYHVYQILVLIGVGLIKERGRISGIVKIFVTYPIAFLTGKMLNHAFIINEIGSPVFITKITAA